jgi:hypothetical protein
VSRHLRRARAVPVRRIVTPLLFPCQYLSVCSRSARLAGSKRIHRTRFLMAAGAAQTLRCDTRHSGIEGRLERPAACRQWLLNDISSSKRTSSAGEDEITVCRNDGSGCSRFEWRTSAIWAFSFALGSRSDENAWLQVSQRRVSPPIRGSIGFLNP